MIKKFTTYIYIIIFFCHSVFSATATWDLNGNGSWNIDGNWTPAAFPNAQDDTAILGSVITRNRILSLGQDITIGNLSINDNNNYRIQDSFTLFFNSTTNSTITVSSTGDHDIRVPVSLLSDLIISQGSTKRFTFFNPISGTQSITKNGLGELRYQGSSANTYSGLTTINAGELRLNMNAGINGIAGNLLIAGGSVKLLRNNQISGSTNVTISSGTFDINRRVETISSLSMSGGSVTLGGAGGASSLSLTNLGTALTMGDGATISEVGTVNLTGGSGGGVIYNGTATPATISSTLDLGSAVRTFTISNGTASFDMEVSGVISGLGGITKTGAGTLKLSGVNTYSVGTTLSGGSLSVAADNNLGNASGTLTFNGGTLLSTTGFTSSRAATLSGAGTVEVTGTPLAMSGIFSGAGPLTKNGVGTLILSGTNTYTGGTTVSSGILQGTTTSLQGAIINNSSVTFDQTIAGTYSGMMSGSGSLTKQNTGTTILSGTNTYTGGTTVSSGVLQGTTTSLQGAITNNASVIFDQAATGTYSGAISGSGILTKTGLGKVTLSGVNTFAGTTSIQQGTLDVNGSLSSPVMISSSATLQGTGSVGTVQNNGTVVPGSSIGTLTITGDYTQDASASLIIEIDDVPAISDLLLITGTANLDGSIGLNPLPGLYEAGTTYTFLQASTINGTFSQLIETHPLDFVINYFPNSVEIYIPFTEAVLPLPINGLKGGAKDIAKYLFSCSTRYSDELIAVLRPLVKVSPKDFSAALLQLGPQQFGSLALSNLQTSTRVGQSMNRTSDSYESYYLTPCYQSFKGPASGSDQSIWFNPIGYYYKQNEMQEQVPFNSKTYGFTTGFNTRLFNHLVLSAGTGYTHSSLDWYENNGNAHIQSVYLSPSVGYVGECGYVGLVLLGTRSFYEVNRKIHFSNFKDKAHNHHKSYDLLAGCRGSLRLKFPENFQKNFFLLPTVNLDYLNIFESGYQESGAGALNLSVKNVHSDFLRPEVKLKLLKELNTCSVCSSPSIYVGWLKNIPLTNGNYTSSFYKQEACTKNFTVQSYHSSTDQLVLGAEVLVVHKANCSLKLGYEANIGNHYNVQEGNLNFNWTF